MLGVGWQRPQFVLNHRNPPVRRITTLGDPELVGLAVEALYGQALLLGYHPVRPADAALLNSSMNSAAGVLPLRRLATTGHEGLACTGTRTGRASPAGGVSRRRG